MSVVFKLILHEQTGTVELLQDGHTVWSSDADAEVLEAFGADEFTEDDIPEVLDYLVDNGFMTSEEADDLFDRDFPEIPELSEVDEDVDADESEEDHELHEVDQ